MKLNTNITKRQFLTKTLGLAALTAIPVAAESLIFKNSVPVKPFYLCVQFFQESKRLRPNGYSWTARSSEQLVSPSKTYEKTIDYIVERAKELLPTDEESKFGIATSVDKDFESLKLYDLARQSAILSVPQYHLRSTVVVLIRSIYSMIENEKDWNRRIPYYFNRYGIKGMLGLSTDGRISIDQRALKFIS